MNGFDYVGTNDFCVPFTIDSKELSFTDKHCKCDLKDKEEEIKEKAREEMADKLLSAFRKAFKKKSPMYGGTVGEVYIKEVIYAEPAVVVFWSDGTKTTSVADTKRGDAYNSEMGLVLAVLKKAIGNNEVARLLKDWHEGWRSPDEGGRVTLANVRKRYRD